MEKIFQPSKYFVLFCGLLVFVFFALQYVVNSRLEEFGKSLGVQIFTWEWPHGKEDLYSSGVVTEARVLKRTETEAVLNVKVQQKLEHRVVAGSTTLKSSMVSRLSENDEAKRAKDASSKSSGTTSGASSGSADIGGVPSETTSEAKLTLYKVDKDWVLGSVELK